MGRGGQLNGTVVVTVPKIKVVVLGVAWQAEQGHVVNSVIVVAERQL
jgi:hypothetical protein